MKGIGKLTVFLIPVGIAVNIVGGQIAILLKLPIWLDGIGTILIGGICGLVPGLIVAAITQIINAISLPTVLPYMIVGFAMAAMGGIFFEERLFSFLPKVCIAGCPCSDCYDSDGCSDGCYYLWRLYWDWQQHSCGGADEPWLVDSCCGDDQFVFVRACG